MDIGPAPGGQVELSAWAELLPDRYPSRKHAEDLKQGPISDSPLVPEAVAESDSRSLDTQLLTWGRGVWEIAVVPGAGFLGGSSGQGPTRKSTPPRPPPPPLGPGPSLPRSSTYS